MCYFVKPFFPVRLWIFWHEEIWWCHNLQKMRWLFLYTVYQLKKDNEFNKQQKMFTLSKTHCIVFLYMMIHSVIVSSAFMNKIIAYHYTWLYTQLYVPNGNWQCFIWDDSSICHDIHLGYTFFLVMN
mgnify:CR=1 FL=1